MFLLLLGFGSMYGAFYLNDDTARGQKFAGTLFMGSLLSVWIFVKTWFREPKSSPGDKIFRDPEYYAEFTASEILPEIAVVDRVLKAFRKIGMPFSKDAKKRILRFLAINDAAETADGPLVLNVLGNMTILGRIRRAGFVAAYRNNKESEVRALRKLRKIPGEARYMTTAHDLQIFIRANADQLSTLNDELANDGIEFRPYDPASPQS